MPCLKVYNEPVAQLQVGIRLDLLLEFLLCAAVILYCGSKLSDLGDAIADKTGLGKNWIGLVLLATVTSLPELITGVSAVTLNNLPDMAISGILGSCMFNMFLVASLDLVSPGKPVSFRVHQGHMLSAGFGILLLSLVALDIQFSQKMPVFRSLNSIDPLSILYFLVYLIAMKLIYQYEKVRLQDFAGEVAETTGTSGHSLKRLISLFVLNALFIVIAACYLPEIGEKIAAVTGWGQTFIGSCLIAITTSLPEATVSYSAARRGSYDMAVANLLGSNLFNIAIISLVDICYVKDPVLRIVSNLNSLSAITAIICTAIVIIGLAYRSERKFLLMAGDAFAVLVVFVLANVLLFAAH